MQDGGAFYLQVNAPMTYDKATRTFLVKLPGSGVWPPVTGLSSSGTVGRLRRSVDHPPPAATFSGAICLPG
jgi:hypothetical protein